MGKYFGTDGFRGEANVKLTVDHAFKVGRYVGWYQMCIRDSNPDMHLIILLIDERPEEVTDIREAICGDNVEVIYSTFDELPDCLLYTSHDSCAVLLCIHSTGMGMSQDEAQILLCLFLRHRERTYRCLLCTSRCV